MPTSKPALLKACQTWDLRPNKETPNLKERLRQLALEDGLLIISKVRLPETEVSPFTRYSLIDGPSAYYSLFTHPTEGDERLSRQRQEHQAWLIEFKSLRQLALQGEDTSTASRLLQSEIVEHLAWEEAELYPRFDAWLGTNRVTRELGYEHLGIRRMLPGLEAALVGDGKVWEKFSLDLIHLLEHHIEHEERGLYPVCERLA